MTLFSDPVLEAGVATLAVFTPICILVTALRFYCAKLAKRRIAIEDWLACAALVTLLLWVALLSLMASNIRTPPGETPPREEAVITGKYLFVASLMFPLNQLFAKLSISFLYYRVFGVIPSNLFWIRAVAALQIVHTVENVFVNIFQCVPVNKFWEPHLAGICIRYDIFLAVNESANCLIDFILAGQAVVMLRSLHKDVKTRSRLSIVFAIGGLAGVIGFVKIGTGLAGGVAVGNQHLMGVWAGVQMGLSIICCCIITFKPLLNRLGTYTANFTSKVSFWRSWRNSGQAQSSPSSMEEQNNGKDSSWIKVHESDQLALNTYTDPV